MDRAGSPAYAALSNGARRALAAIEAAIDSGDGSGSASVSYISFGLDYGISRKTVTGALKALDALGMIDIEQGWRLVNRFRLSNRWRTIDAVEAARLSALAREPKAGIEKPSAPKPVKQRREKPPKVERRRYSQRRMPSLPTMPWQDDGR